MIRHWFCMLLLLLPMASSGDGVRVRPVDWAQPMIGTELDNFYRVSDQVFRSRQPDDEEMQVLASMGMRTILNLREYHTDDDEAEGTNLTLIHVPVDAGKIDDAFVVEALSAINEADKPILIHCWHGSDRTGVVSAMYRMVFQGWPRERAIDEFVHGGYGYHARFYPNIESYLEAVDVDVIRQRVMPVQTAGQMRESD